MSCFYYDAQNKPAVALYDGVAYAYMYNLQGDVIALVDADGTKVVEYRYDAWGTPLSKTGTLATTLGTLNPFRYRGYVYDEETGLYYLRSRYYNPEWSRFVNADVVYRRSVYAYCNNCPSMKSDKDGYAAMVCYFDDMGLGNLMLGAMSYGGSGGLGSATVNDIVDEYRSNVAPKAGSQKYPLLNLTPEDLGNALIAWGQRHWVELTVGSASAKVSSEIFLTCASAGHPVVGAALGAPYFAAFNFIGGTVQAGINATLDNNYASNPGLSGLGNVTDGFFWSSIFYTIGHESGALEKSWTWLHYISDYL